LRLHTEQRTRLCLLNWIGAEAGDIDAGAVRPSSD